METLKNHPIKVTVWTAVIVVVSIVCFFVGANDRIKDVESSIKHLNGKTDLYTERYEKVIDEQRKQELLVARFVASVENIEKSIDEIKEAIK